MYTQVNKVTNAEGEDVCALSIGYNPNLKNYDEATVVLREAAKDCNVMQISKAFVNFLKENPEVVDYHEITFAFPYHGGLLLKLDVLGNMDDKLFDELEYAMAVSICDLVLKWISMKNQNNPNKVVTAKRVRDNIVHEINKRRHDFVKDILLDQVAECRWFD